MANFNKVILVGNLTRDPELRRIPSGTAVVDLGLAVNRTFTGKDGERREEATFVDVSVWDRQAETCAEYLKKGSPILVEGSLKMDTWDDKSTGEKRSKLKVHAERIQFLGRREGGPSGPGPDDEYSAPTPAPRESAPRRPAPDPRGVGNGPSRGGYNSPPAPASTRRAPTPPADSDADDDDIPF